MRIRSTGSWSSSVPRRERAGACQGKDRRPRKTKSDDTLAKYSADVNKNTPHLGSVESPGQGGDRYRRFWQLRVHHRHCTG